MKKSKLLKAIVMICMMTLLLAGCGEKTTTTSDKKANKGAAKESSAAPEASKETVTETTADLLSGKHHVNIVIRDKGTITVELDADKAPITVTNFVNLVKDGFYDGVVFHRIIDGFMMQGGDPTGTGNGGAEHNIKGEFASNGVANSLSHTRGAISMARATDPDSASSQFFIVHEDSTYLDGDYACFGYVTDGMDIVDDICKNTKGGDRNGIIPTGNRPVIETIEVVDDTTTSAKDTEETTVEETETIQESTQEAEEEQETEVTETTEELLFGKHHVNIVVKDMGIIAVELDADVAPITVTNFINLSKEGFYDGLTFHRIIDGFMMQGGDPTGTGYGGSDKNIKGEFSQNGIENNLSHTRGAISMARALDMDGANSQFFIMQQDATYLDGGYACFGYVTDGMDIVDDICKNTKGGDENGIIPTGNRPVIETIEVVD